MNKKELKKFQKQKQKLFDQIARFTVDWGLNGFFIITNGTLLASRGEVPKQTKMPFETWGSSEVQFFIPEIQRVMREILAQRELSEAEQDTIYTNELCKLKQVVYGDLAQQVFTHNCELDKKIINAIEKFEEEVTTERGKTRNHTEDNRARN